MASSRKATRKNRRSFLGGFFSASALFPAPPTGGKRNTRKASRKNRKDRKNRKASRKNRKASRKDRKNRK